MDIPSNKWRSNAEVTSQSSLLPQSASSQYKASDTNVSVSSLAFKLTKAQPSIDNAQLNQRIQSREMSKVASNTENNRNEIASAKWQFKHLSKVQLETIALDSSNTFSGFEKIVAYDQWHALDQADLSGLKRNALQNHSTVNAMASFEEALLSRTRSFSSLSKAMVSNEYSSQAMSQFKSTLNELGLATSQDDNQSEYYAIMVESIFGGNEPEVQSGVDGMSPSNAMKSPFEFLTQKDRELFADMYQYAAQNDIDFEYLRRLGSDLGDYRKHDDGNITGNYNEGHFDAEGHQLIVSFTDKDQTTIDSLLTSDALASTALDNGFISFITEPGLGALSHVGSYQFLQHMVEVTAGIKTSVSSGEFKIFEDFSRIEDRYIMTASEEVFPMPEPDVVCKNGHCEVTEKGRENGVTLEQSSSTFMPAFDLKSESIESLLQQRTNTKTQEKAWFRWLMND